MYKCATSAGRGLPGEKRRSKINHDRGMGEGEGMNEKMNPHSKPVMRMVICPINGWYPLTACSICEYNNGIHTNIDTSDTEVSCGYIAANVCEGE